MLKHFCINVIKMQIVFSLALVATLASAEHTREKRSETCVLPPYPEHGTYIVAGDPTAKPGEDPDSAFLNVTCSQGYSMVGSNVVYCVKGQWSNSMPQCARPCHLPERASVEYHCEVPDGPGTTRACNEYEPVGTIVRPRCRRFYYVHTTTLPKMHCIDGSWDYLAACKPECGIIPSSGHSLIREIPEDMLPWYTTIYKKKDNDVYSALCVGSIISNNLIVTAAHCFWSSQRENITPSDYAVVVGATRREWDPTQQSYNVSDIKIPPRYQGQLANFQEDIALLKVSSGIQYSSRVRPVCLDFGTQFERIQLKAGNIGKVAAWNSIGAKTSRMEVLELSYIDIDQCIRMLPVQFREYLTSSDKFCTGVAKNGTALCRGNSGSGLSFANKESGIDRYYLRGVVSTAPQTDSSQAQDLACSPSTRILLTSINKHSDFIKDNFMEI